MFEDDAQEAGFQFRKAPVLWRRIVLLRPRNTFLHLSFFRGRSADPLLFADALTPVSLFSAPFSQEYPIGVFEVKRRMWKNRCNIFRQSFYSSKIITIVPNLDEGRQ